MAKSSIEDRVYKLEQALDAVAYLRVQLEIRVSELALMVVGMQDKMKIDSNSINKQT